MKAYRIADARHRLMDGTGAFLHGGRWNSRGQRIVYAAATYAGALLEQLAHANIGRLPMGQAWIEIEIPPDLPVRRVLPEEVHEWDAGHMETSRRCGDRWIRARETAVLLVPSVVTAGIECNVLINQDHPDFARISASSPQPVRWDPRLARA